MLPGYKSADRFYESAIAEPSPDGSRVLLDGRPLKTPLRAELRLPTFAMAQAIAEEWNRQTDKINVSDMPSMALACTALDRIAPNREEMEATLLSYGGNDLLCYWAEGPASLLERQRKEWQPILDWAAGDLGVELTVSVGVIHQPQPKEALQKISEILSALDDFRLAALSSIAAATNSLLVGLAMLKGRLGPDEAFSTAELDSLYQQEFWGIDAEAERDRKALLKELQDIKNFIECI